MRDEQQSGREPAEIGAAVDQTAQSRDSAGASAEGPIEPTAEGVLTLVCFTCGKEYYFADAPPPEGISCEKCGGTVFRSFYSPTENDEAARDFEDTTGRSLDPDDPEGDTLPGDLIDLNRG